MSRVNYCWAVMRNSEIIAGFTNKQKMIYWIEDNPHILIRRSVFVYKVRLDVGHFAILMGMPKDFIEIKETI